MPCPAKMGRWTGKKSTGNKKPGFEYELEPGWKLLRSEQPKQFNSVPIYSRDDEGKATLVRFGKDHGRET